MDALLALCEAAHSAHDPRDVTQLVALFTDYLPNCPCLALQSSPFLHSLEASPWELLTRRLTIALLSLGSRHPQHRNQIHESILAYIDACYLLAKDLPTLDSQADCAGRHGSLQDVADIASLAASLVGFLDGISLHAHFCEPSERLQIIEKLHIVLSERLLVAVEASSSTIRNLRNSELSLQYWRRYAKLSIAAGRPIGSLLLQQAFLNFVKSCTSPAGKNGRMLSGAPLLDHYISGMDRMRQDDDKMVSLAKYAAQIAADHIQLLEEGSDYLLLKVPWQQHLAFSAKSSALLTFINCVVLDEESADIDLLLSWLEATLLNVDQMANSELATVAFKSLVILSKFSRLNASNLTRTLLRFIVQNGHSGTILAVAAHCLAQNLRLLSQDTVIGTLYSLGNVLSASSAYERPDQCIAIAVEEGFLSSPHLVRDSQQSNQSVISLTLNGEEDTTITYKNVVNAIITIATSSKDNKIVALAQSMLLQKIGRVNICLDACIIQETAGLALKSDPAEFQVLLKFYARLYRDATAQGNGLVVEAVNTEYPLVLR